LPETENPRKIQEGLGLNNTRSRLQQLYGNNYKLELSNIVSGGVMVSMEIPLSFERRMQVVEA
jgi:sensor histidine kinase YesM